MSLKLITAPTVEPVTAAEILPRLGISSGDIGTPDIEAAITGARTWAEQFCNRAFITQTWEKALDVFPDAIELPRPPTLSIVSVKYLDANGVEQLLANTEYLLDDYSQPGWLTLAYGKSWPDTYGVPNAVKVRYTAGYGAAAAVPQPIKNAIVLIVGQALRGQPGLENNLYPASIPNAAKELLQPYRIISF